MKNLVKPDAALKDYWRDNRRFADLFNQVLFDGNPILHPDRLSEKDTEESSIINVSGQHASVSKDRDVLKEYADGTSFLLIGIENQQKVHYAMPVRTMLYDALRYTQQCKALEKEHRENNDLNTPDEFLSGITKHDKLKPVFTLVVYYGEMDWDGPTKLSDMLSISPQFQRFFDDQRLNLLQAKHTECYQFQHTDNQDLFGILQEFLQTGRIDKTNYQRKVIYWETLAAIGAATGSQKLTKYANAHKEKGGISMCTALENLEKEAMEKGIEQGEIKFAISLYRKGKLDKETCAEQLNISVTEFEQLLEEIVD